MARDPKDRRAHALKALSVANNAPPEQRQEWARVRGQATARLWADTNDWQAMEAIAREAGRDSEFAKWGRDQMRQHGLSLPELRRRVGTTWTTTHDTLTAARKPTRATVERFVRGLAPESDHATLLARFGVAAHPKPGLRELLAVVEAKRTAAGLSRGSAAAEIGLKPSQYSRLDQRRAALRVCGRLVHWLAGTDAAREDVFGWAERILRWEGYWDQMSPTGQVMGPALLAKGWTEIDLAQRAEVSMVLIARLLWLAAVAQHRGGNKGVKRTRYPRHETLVRIAGALDLGLEHLEAAAKLLPDVHGRRHSAMSRARVGGEHWLGTTAARALMLLRHRVQRFGSANLQKRVRAQRSAEYRWLLGKAQGKALMGRPPQLLDRDIELSTNAAILHDDGGLSAREIGEMMGFTIFKDQRGHESQARHAWHFIELGRALRGKVANPPLP